MPDETESGRTCITAARPLVRRQSRTSPTAETLPVGRRDSSFPAGVGAWAWDGRRWHVAVREKAVGHSVGHGEDKLMRTSGTLRLIQYQPEARRCARAVADHATASTVAWAIALRRRDRVATRVWATRLPTPSREKSADGVLRLDETMLCIPVYSHDQKEHHMHATGTDSVDLEDDLRLVTLPDAARFLSVSRGSLYDLLTTGQLPSVHIGRSRRIPMGEIRRYVRERLERDSRG